MSSVLSRFVVAMARSPSSRREAFDLPSRYVEGDAGVWRRLVFSPDIAVWAQGEICHDGGADIGGIALGMSPASPDFETARPGANAINAWIRDRSWTPAGERGRHCQIFWDIAARRLVAVVDAFRTIPVYYAVTSDWVVCTSDLRLILATGVVTPTASSSAIFHYLNFSYVPSPYTAIEGIEKLPAGHALEYDNGTARATRYWHLRYPEDLAAPEQERVGMLHDRIVSTVQRYRPTEGAWGTFLSGGTDSSSIAGILAREPGAAKVATFSIGFDEEGYDELGYAQIAADHFGLAPRMRRVDEAYTVALIPRLAAEFDEPFGNASAIPTYACAELAAAEGVSTLIAGDGGDEIFGGNERYRKDVIFDRYFRAPWPVRAAGSVAAHLLKPFDFRFGNRVRNFVSRGSLPNPDRFYTDDSFASDHFAELLGESFRSRISPDDSLDVQRAIYAVSQAPSEIHRLMYLDLMMTIADNDIVKVTRAARLANVAVAFPYLDRDLVEFTGRLPGSDMVHGLEKRYLFKLAMQDILPQAIRAKKKQGFGLPTAVWLRNRGAYRELTYDTILSSNALARGYFRPEFIRELLQRHDRGQWDYSPELYRLLMLELWHRSITQEPVSAR